MDLRQDVPERGAAVHVEFRLGREGDPHRHDGREEEGRDEND
jgi:hypothetical protein